MTQNERTLTFQAYDIPSRRYLLEAGCRTLGQTAAGRLTPLLPESWTDEDAWQLARTLAGRMAHAKWYCAFSYTEEDFPAEETPLSDFPSDEGTFPLDLCAEVLHCGILAAVSAPRDLLPCKGTFGALEELFSGIVMTDSGPMLRFEAMLRLLPPPVPPEELTEKGRELTAGGGLSALREVREIREQLHIWRWLESFPCRDALLRAAGRIRSEDCYAQAVAFVRSNMAAMEDIASLHRGTGMDGVGYSGFLREAIDLHLYQMGVLNLSDLSALFKKLH